VNTYVSAIAKSGNTVYVGGSFTGIGGLVRNHLAAIDLVTGQPTAWNPGANAQVRALVARGSTLYAGGDFDSVGGMPRSRIAAVDLASGSPTSWAPQITGTTVHALAVSGSKVYAGGVFGNIGLVERRNIGAIDAATGIATAWNPNANSDVSCIAVGNGVVYVGGIFSIIGGTGGASLAALDTTTGMATAWVPNLGGWTLALALDGAHVYAGGSFPGGLVALDPSSGAVIWSANAGNFVTSIAVDGSAIFAGGVFQSIGGQPRRHACAVNPMTGYPTQWRPNPDGPVYALAVDDQTVYAGGAFRSIGGSAHGHLAALAKDGSTPVLPMMTEIDAGSGRVRIDWYATGSDVVSGEVQRRTGDTDWAPLARIAPDGRGYLSYEDRSVVAGTRYGYRLGIFKDGQEISVGEVWVTAQNGSASLQGAWPNPAVRGRVLLHFVLAQAAPAEVTVFDVVGRIVLQRSLGRLTPGPHEVNLAETAPLAPGLYLVRLRQGADVRTFRVISLN
jgi:outer membrane protein assembly factor BamB